jgi:hypothetical protein
MLGEKPWSVLKQAPRLSEKVRKDTSVLFVGYEAPSLSSLLAVAAKAPRKNLPSSGSSVSPSGGSRLGKKKAKGNGGNPFKMWPTPKWQQNLHSFLGVEQPGSSNSSSSAGESSSSASTSAEVTAEAQVIAGTSAGSSSSSYQDGVQGSSSNIATGLELLSGDIAQLNSDSEDDE